MPKHFSKQLSPQVHIEGKLVTDKKMSFYHSQKMSSFRKGLIHDFSQNVKLLPKLIFLEKGLGMMFDDVPYRKKVFLDYTNVILT